MKYCKLLLFLLLSSCAPLVTVTDHDWIIKDENTKTCFYLSRTYLRISNRVTWLNINDQWVHTSENFDIAVVKYMDFDAAAKRLNVEFVSCSNGLLEPGEE